LILAAGADVFATSGYDRASMRAVARAAGITTPVLYDHFASKADLYATLVESHASSLIAHWEQVALAAAQQQASTEQVFVATIDAIYGWIEDNEHGWRMIFLDSPSDPAVADAQRRRQERATAVLSAQFARVPGLHLSVDLPRERVDELLAEAAKWTVNAIAAWWWNNRDLSRAQIVSLTADLLWRGLNTITSD
jgi:AcrR family transcriptional regulator